MPCADQGVPAPVPFCAPVCEFPATPQRSLSGQDHMAQEMNAGYAHDGSSSLTPKTVTTCIRELYEEEMRPLERRFSGSSNTVQVKSQPLRRSALRVRVHLV